MVRAAALTCGSFESETGLIQISGEWRVKSSQRRVLGAGKHLMARLYFLRVCANTDKMRNVPIK